MAGTDLALEYTGSPRRRKDDVQEMKSIEGKHVLTKSAFMGGAAVALMAFSGMASAATITCPDSPSARQATFSNVYDCHTQGGVTGTPKEDDVLGFYPGDPWSGAGAIAGSNGTSGSLSNLFLTIDVTSGSWGSGNVSGTWGIDPSFWASYGEAVLTMHVGNGNGDPDWWFFGVTQGATSGTFSYTNSGQGGGLSNLFLWGRGDGTQVPEPTSLALLGLGLAGLGIARRRRS